MKRKQKHIPSNLLKIEKLKVTKLNSLYVIKGGIQTRSICCTYWDTH